MPGSAGVSAGSQLRRVGYSVAERRRHCHHPESGKSELRPLGSGILGDMGWFVPRASVQRKWVGLVGLNGGKLSGQGVRGGWRVPWESGLPAERGAEHISHVGEDLDVILVLERERQRERDLGDLPEAGLVPRPRIVAVEQANGQEAEFRQRGSGLWHEFITPGIGDANWLSRS